MFHSFSYFNIFYFIFENFLVVWKNKILKVIWYLGLKLGPRNGYNIRKICGVTDSSRSVWNRFNVFIARCLRLHWIAFRFLPSAWSYFFASKLKFVFVRCCEIKLVDVYYQVLSFLYFLDEKTGAFSRPNFGMSYCSAACKVFSMVAISGPLGGTIFAPIFFK